MKKYLVAVSALILVLSVLLTSCGKKNVYVDDEGNSHKFITNDDGSRKLDRFGNFYEVVTDKNSKTTATQLYAYDSVSTNKAKSVVENQFIKIKVPNDWKFEETSNKILLHHSGKCTKAGDAACEISIDSSVSLGVDALYEKKISPARWLTEYSGECGKLNEYDTKVLGCSAKAFSYTLNETDMTCCNYFFKKGVYTVNIEVFAYKDCYTEEQILELLTEICTLKNLPESQTTTKAPSTEASAK